MLSIYQAMDLSSKELIDELGQKPGIIDIVLR